MMTVVNFGFYWFSLILSFEVRATPLRLREGAGGGALNLSEVKAVPPIHPPAGGGEVVRG